MPSYKTIGIILRRTNYGDADRIYTFITPAHGKVEGIAKGVRRMKAKLGSHLELFSVIELMLAKGKNLDVITSARARDSWDNLTKDYERVRRAFLFCEMVNKLTGHDTTKPLYQLLVIGLDSLDDGIEPEFVELYFKLHLLEQLGYKPELSGKPGEQHFFNMETGGISNEQGERLSQDEVKLMRLLFDFPLKQVAKVKGIDTPSMRLLSILNRFYDHHFSQRFKSAEI